MDGSILITLSNQVTRGTRVITISNQTIRGSIVITLYNQITFLKSLTESVVISDSLDTYAHNLVLFISENILTSDGIGKESIFSRGVDDLVSLVDVPRKYDTISRVDSISVNDSLTILRILVERLFNDTLSLSDSITKEVGRVGADNVALVDYIVPGGGTVINDIVFMLDAISGKDLEKNLTDAIILIDNEDKLVLSNFGDVLVVSDITSLLKGILAAITDSVTLSDVILSSVIHQTTTTIPSRRCLLLDIIRKGLSLFHYTNDDLVTRDLQGDGVVIHIPHVLGMDDNSILSDIDSPPQSENFDLGETRGIIS